jgi:hypothetical protein
MEIVSLFGVSIAGFEPTSPAFSAKEIAVDRLTI